MTEFDYGLLRKLFERNYLFWNHIDGYKPREGAEITDNIDGSDITACLDLSILPQLKKIKRAENIDLMAYRIIKDGEKTIGARGVVFSFDDWWGIDNPGLHYEFGHFEMQGGIEEYVKDLPTDSAFIQVFTPLDKKSCDQEKGSEQSRVLIQRAIENTSGLIGDTQASLIKYRCLIEGEKLELWKVGFNEGVRDDGFYKGAYQVFIIAPNFIKPLYASPSLFECFANREKLTMEQQIEPMDARYLERVRLNDPSDNWFWYGLGSVELI